MNIDIYIYIYSVYIYIYPTYGYKLINLSNLSPHHGTWVMNSNKAASCHTQAAQCSVARFI